MSEIQIERFYRCRISYEAAREDQGRIEEKSDKLAPRSVEVTVFQGNPACHPFLEAESQSMTDISTWRGKVLRYINRFSSTRILN